MQKVENIFRGQITAAKPVRARLCQAKHGMALPPPIERELCVRKSKERKMEAAP